MPSVSRPIEKLSTDSVRMARYLGDGQECPSYETGRSAHLTRRAVVPILRDGQSAYPIWTNCVGYNRGTKGPPWESTEYLEHVPR